MRGRPGIGNGAVLCCCASQIGGTEGQTDVSKYGRAEIARGFSSASPAFGFNHLRIWDDGHIKEHNFVKYTIGLAGTDVIPSFLSF